MAQGNTLAVNLHLASTNGHPGIVPCAHMCAAGAELTIVNPEAASSRNSYTLANFAGGVSGDIVLSAESAAALPGGASEWRLTTSGNVLKLVKNVGMMILVF